MASRKLTTNKAPEASLDDLGRDVLRFFEAIQGGLEGLHAIANRIQTVLSDVCNSLTILADGISATAEAVKRLDEAGWLPHVTTPLAALAPPEVSALSE